MSMSSTSSSPAPTATSSPPPPGGNDGSSNRPLDYSTYLRLDKILHAQDAQSAIHRGKISHDEHLFIITHQTYELWFKQLLFEVDWLRESFFLPSPGRPDGLLQKKMGLAVARAARCHRIMKLLVEQVDVLATMTPLGFMEFRGLLVPASGFQSVQFRLLENKLGQESGSRVTYNQCSYGKSFEDEDAETLERLEESERSASLCTLVGAWLERLPGFDEFEFAKVYEAAVGHFLGDELADIEGEPDDAVRKPLLLGHRAKQEKFRVLFDEATHAEKKQRGAVRFSRRAILGAIMLMLYREEGRFHEPAMLMEVLMDLDTELSKWRFGHMMLVQRMGPRPAACGEASLQQTGRGGSSGYQYLRATLSDRYRVFLDLFNLPAYFVPEEYVPPLTVAARRAIAAKAADVHIAA